MRFRFWNGGFRKEEAPRKLGQRSPLRGFARCERPAGRRRRGDRRECRFRSGADRLQRCSLHKKRWPKHHLPRDASRAPACQSEWASRPMRRCADRTTDGHLMLPRKCCGVRSHSGQRPHDGAVASCSDGEALATSRTRRFGCPKFISDLRPEAESCASKPRFGAVSRSWKTRRLIQRRACCC
jgi:hypothetical protein